MHPVLFSPETCSANRAEERARYWQWFRIQRGSDEMEANNICIGLVSRHKLKRFTGGAVGAIASDVDHSFYPVATRVRRTLISLERQPMIDPVPLIDFCDEPFLNSAPFVANGSKQLSVNGVIRHAKLIP
jgi:hypothetical protein